MVFSYGGGEEGDTAKPEPPGFVTQYVSWAPLLASLFFLHFCACMLLCRACSVLSEVNLVYKLAHSPSLSLPFFCRMTFRTNYRRRFLGGPLKDGVGAELPMLFATVSNKSNFVYYGDTAKTPSFFKGVHPSAVSTPLLFSLGALQQPVKPAAFARGKAKSPAFMHTIGSPAADPEDITGAKARTRLRLLEGRHRDVATVRGRSPYGRAGVLAEVVVLRVRFYVFNDICCVCVVYCFFARAHTHSSSVVPPCFSQERRP